jgi:hypothetical protein
LITRSANALVRVFRSLPCSFIRFQPLSFSI